MQDNYWTRRQSRRRLLVGASATAGAALLAACSGGKKPPASSSSGGSTANAPRGGSITSTIIATDAKSFHPYQTTDTASSGYYSSVYATGLTKYDPNTLDHIPDMAQQWSISDDKKTYTFTLKDIAWSDGTPLTTDDFVWTYQQAIKPENQYPYRENLNTITSYVAKDPKTLAVTTQDALAVGLENADAIVPLPRHIWEKYSWTDPSKNPEIFNPSVASGMWKLKEWKRDDHATFNANDSYYDGRPNIDSTTVRVIGTPELGFQALKSGDIDYNASIQPSDYKSAKKLSNINVPEWYAANGNWTYAGFNLRRPAWQDLKVRQAIAYATDRNGIIASVLYGLGRPTYSAFPQSSWAYNPNVEHYDFNVNKAKDLLKQAGYNLDSQKKLVKDGKPLTIKMLYPTSSPTRTQIATILQQQLGQLGATVNVQGLEFQAYISAIQSEPFDWDIQLGGWSSTIDPHWSYQIWSEQSIPDLNPGAYVNKQVETLFDQGSKEFDLNKRKQIYGQIQQMITNDLPYVFLYEVLSFAGLNKKIRGITATRLGIEYNMNKWYIQQ